MRGGGVGEEMVWCGGGGDEGWVGRWEGGRLRGIEC